MVGWKGKGARDAKIRNIEKSKDKKNFLSPFLLFSLHLNRYFTGKQHVRWLIAIIEETKYCLLTFGKTHQSTSLVPVPDCEIQIFLVNIKAKGQNKILLATHLLYNQPSKWCQQREHRAFHELAVVILKYKRSEFTEKTATSPFKDDATWGTLHSSLQP